MKNDFSKRQSEDSRFILPITAVIETGNHIAQLSDGQVKRAIAEKFSQMFELTAQRQAPWILSIWGSWYRESAWLVPVFRVSGTAWGFLS